MKNQDHIAGCEKCWMMAACSVKFQFDPGTENQVWHKLYSTQDKNVQCFFGKTSFNALIGPARLRQSDRH